MRTRLPLGLRVLLILVILLNLLAIFGFSAQDASHSTETSHSVSEPLIHLFYPDFESYPDDEQSSITTHVDSIVRTLAHCILFLPMAFAATLFSLTFPWRVRYSVALRAGLSYLFSLLAAVFDEIHQAFVPGRAFQFTDLLYDSIGMILGCLSATFILLLYQKTKKSKSQ